MTDIVRKDSNERLSLSLIHILIDWDTVNQNRDDWNKRWTREIER